MDKWEYLSLRLDWKKQEQNWESRLADGRVMIADSFQALLNPLGADGWELIAFIPSLYGFADTESTSGTFYWAVTKWDADQYRAIFKRRLT